LLFFFTLNDYFFIEPYQNITAMGRGDIKTKKGKRHIGSFGKLRPHKIKKSHDKKTGEQTEKKA
jgi:ribosomal small subunit protein bTHX